MYARIAVARPLRGLLTYAVPPGLLPGSGELAVGHVVLVPLGRRGAETGYVVERIEEPGFDPKKIKPIQRVLDPEPAFDARQLGFLRWVADYYAVPLGPVLQTAVPSAIRARTLTVLEPTDEGVDALATGEAGEPEAMVLREVVSRPGATRRSLARRLADELEAAAVQRATDRLVRAGWAAWGTRDLKETRGRVKTAALVVAADRALELVPRAGTRMRALIDRLAAAGGPVDVPVLRAEQGVAVSSSLQRLVEAGVVGLSEREQRDALVDAPAMGSSTPPALNAHQRAALEVLTAEGATGAHLLFGVTGSGKTEVFLGAARHALDRGRQVLVLVPEIGLTPQLVGRFKARFGGDVAVLHSGLTGAERLSEWRRIRAGEAKVAVGARSALFAPFADLGLVVVDEEHDDSYKQDDAVPYNARDLAVVLGRRHDAPVVLASATPSLESWANAEHGRYHLLELPERATPRPVPRVEIVDLSQVAPEPAEPSREGGAGAGKARRPLLAPEVTEALRRTFDAGGKAIVLYNRRGYATLVQCTSCGGTYECPSCGIAMTLHRRAGVVACHTCGFKRPYVDRCPACNADALEELGKGTERVSEWLAERFGDVGLGRMDADTTSQRGAHHRILDAFRRGDTRLLVGTQIVAKGHDFPDVHTAVVVSADQGLRLPDFRASERTWSLLVQVAGRAGRGEVPGRVFVQTYTPDHHVLRHLDDARGFFEAELELRRMLRYPPFTRLVLVRLEGVDRRGVLEAARGLAGQVRRAVRDLPGLDVLGPAPAALPKRVGRWRFQILLRGEAVGPLREGLRRCLHALDKAGGRGVRVGWDVDPRHLL